ncbi:MAG TPA: 16S rRNA (cytidine(1402)-2'-O)-methyltransferase [Gammaproteobacteria bacterium]|nr:16S rRNA (cytidine(1402)-2'-O)-methyltransferase [Gammaproteobacteria bacterium]
MGIDIVSGTLYIVATPIGNLRDISARAIEVLGAVALVAAEDTRHTAGLLNHLGLQKKLLSLHSFNENARVQQVLERLQQGDSIALVSDAGTPLISDPGFPLVRAARAAGIMVSPVPGPSALIAALSVSGLPCDRFVFEGFLPAKQGARRSHLEALKSETRSMVFYESPHRIESCIRDMDDIIGGEREVVLLRELTKTFEEIHADSLKGLQQWLTTDSNHRRGEFVIVLAGAEAQSPGTEDQEALLKVLLDYMSVKDAAAAASRLSGVPKRTLYQLAVALKG